MRHAFHKRHTLIAVVRTTATRDVHFRIVISPPPFEMRLIYPPGQRSSLRMRKCARPWAWCWFDRLADRVNSGAWSSLLIKEPHWTALTSLSWRPPERLI